MAQLCGQRADELMRRMAACDLCPRRCGVNRLRGEIGVCGLGDRLVVSHVLPHFGEEPPISGERGAGTIFFSSCNLRCVFCQNYQISHDMQGNVVAARELAEEMLLLQDQGCHNIEAVTPTPQLPFLLEALALAFGQGLDLPIVYNCGGYENAEVVRMLDGIVDVYLPDFKYGTDADAAAFSGVRDYATHAIASIREMIRQCGDELVAPDDIALRGVIIRHLVLPGRVQSSFDALKMIRNEISASVPISIMSQYTPIQAVRNHPLLNRRITKEEYDTAVDYALDLGFETIFAQEVDEAALTPDFGQEKPFRFAE